MTLQDIIHYIEVGAGKRFLRIILPILAILMVAVVRDFRSWTNFSAPEAMDSAQLARNIADGKGYTTLFIRPLSIYLIQQKNQSKADPAATDAAADPARIKTMAHPDIANAPVYPLMLAGLMKIWPFHFATDLKGVFWTDNGRFYRYQPDFVIGVFNLVIFLVVVAVSYGIAKKIFDAGIAALSVTLILGSAVLWHFNASGLSTMLLLLFFLGLVWCALKIEEIAREEEPDSVRILCWSGIAGILTGIGALTRYSFGWTIIPIVVFILLFAGPKKLANGLTAFVAFAIVLTPWIARNIAVSGTPFGTAGYAIFAQTSLFPGSLLERSLNPDFTGALSLMPYWHKFLENLRPIFENDLFKLGDTWAGTLFFAGLLLGFNRPAARRIRYFLLMCLATFIVVQALGRTELSDDSPEINSENMLVLAVPMVIIFGTAFFFILLDQIKLPARELRYVVTGIFVTLCCLPLAASMWFKNIPIAYPPYYPPDIEQAAGWMKEDELMMSDMPWAVAWYGHHQCAWLTVNSEDQFFSLNDYVKPVSALYLTRRTMDSKLVSDCLLSGKNTWQHFVLDAVTRNDLPKDFPLRHAPAGSVRLISGLFLTDTERWKIDKNSSP